MVKLGAALKMLRKRKGLGIVAAGEAVGLSNGTVSQWENDQVKSLDREKLQAFADLYELEVWQLFQVAAGRDADPRAYAFEDPDPKKYLQSDPPEVAELIHLVRQMPKVEASALLAFLKVREHGRV